jgi:hypothetical protein
MARRASRRHGTAGRGDACGAGAGQLTEPPAFARTLASEAPPKNCVGPNGPVAKFKSWQTCGSTVGAVAALALVAGTATASAAVRAARAATDFLQDNI